MSLGYRYQLRCLGGERFEVELSDGRGVGSRPHLWFDRGQLTLREPSRGLGFRRLFNPPPSPRLTSIRINLGAWLEVMRAQDLLEIGHQEGHRWLQLARRGRLELRVGNLTRVEFPEAQMVNTFEENGSLEVRSDRARAQLACGHTMVVGAYHLYLHRLEGFKAEVSYRAEGWVARDSYPVDWVMKTFELVGESELERS